MQSSEWVHGAIVGGAVAGGLIAAILITRSHGCEQSSCSSEVPGILAFVALFAVVGALVGSGIHKT